MVGGGDRSDDRAIVAQDAPAGPPTVTGRLDVEQQAGAPTEPTAPLGEDERKLADLGYRQELTRAWSGFTNFAISFTIISVLAGTWTTFSTAWNNGGPIGVSIGWPVICILVLTVAVSMAELTSAFPTAGGPYWWAAKLGGAGWSWFTGWMNIVGLVGIVASVGYGAATFLNITLGVYGVDVFGVNFADSSHFLVEQFALFLLVMIFYTLVNIFGDRLLALFNNISVGWHVLGVAVIIVLLVFVPDHHQNFSFVFTHKLNLVGFGHGSTVTAAFWFLVLPLGFLLTMYTQTGYDASAHTAEETRGAALAAAQGVWRSVFWSAVIGWFVLLALLFAATNVGAVNEAGGTSNSIVTTSLANHLWAAKAILIIVTIGQLFCGAAGLTSASRTWYAFSRDRAMPGWSLFRRLNRDRVPLYGVIAVSVASVIISIPALKSTAAAPTFPWAFFAITGICTVGLYVAYTIPIYLRLRQGDRFQTGPWNLGRHYRWINMVAIVWVAITVVIFFLPFGPASVPWFDEFDISAVNYTPAVLVVAIIVWIWWAVDAKNRYTGPVRTLEEDEVTAD
jgi:amino acid transporter